MREQYILLGTIRLNTTILAYRVLNTMAYTGRVIPVNDMGKFVNSCGVLGVEYNNGKLTGTNGSIDRYPIISEDGNTLIKNNAIIIIGEIVSSDPKKANSYLCSDFNGTVIALNETDIINFTKAPNNLIANGKIVTKGNKQYVSAISGQYPKIKAPKEEQPVKTDKALTEEEIIKEIKYCLNIVAKAVIKQGGLIKNYDEVSQALIQAKIYNRNQLRANNTLEKVVDTVMKLSASNNVE